ncbi:hypothetical protein MLD38_038362 [Melastoma candidum]|uniref:Uncharacterized protein n=1 Tax=Melastoma candidum TaxID=119954 RepID=A0ACB9KYY7_9MYRT|nr:hypothetical protein MLD38_038362 [Melastoma candidum]
MGGDGGALALLIAVSLISSSAASSSELRDVDSIIVLTGCPGVETGYVSPGLHPPASQLPSNLREDQSKKSKILDSLSLTGSDHKIPDVSASVNHPDGKQKVNNTKKDQKRTSEAIVNKDTCFTNPKHCTDQGSLSACIVGFASDAGNNNLQLLVENTGDTDLKVNHNFQLIRGKKDIEVHKHDSVKINVSSVPGESIKLVLSAGHGDCMLLIGPLIHPEINYSTYLPTFDKLLTPINGEVRYQQLEMGSQEEAPGVMNAGSVDGWDEGWDDDWDEENAVKSPAARLVGNISAHGLTSRGANKNGWENDWDD